MSHWFGLRPDDLNDLTEIEIAEYLCRLSKLPPIGGSIAYMKKG